jgi:hypothetical protein
VRKERGVPQTSVGIQSVEGYILNGGPDFTNSHFSHEWIEENDPDMCDLITRYFPSEDFAYEANVA